MSAVLDPLSIRPTTSVQNEVYSHFPDGYFPRVFFFPERRFPESRFPDGHFPRMRRFPERLREMTLQSYRTTILRIFKWIYILQSIRPTIRPTNHLVPGKYWASWYALYAIRETTVNPKINRMHSLNSHVN